jgi:hypothetical protein
MEASQHSLLAACFTLHSINATLAIVPQRGAGLWISQNLSIRPMKLGGHVAWVKTGGIRCAYIIYGGKLEGKSPLRRSNIGGKNMLKWIFEI